MAELAAVVAVTLVLCAIVALLGHPLRRGPEAMARVDSARVRDLEAAREAKYQEIRDAELDARLGKLSAEDHRALDRQLRAEAMEILRELDELEQLDELK
jgi:cell division protein FtsB